MSGDLVVSHGQRATLAQILGDPNVSLVRAANTYLMSKRRRLAETTQRGHQQVIDELTARHPKMRLAEFEPPNGAFLLEDFLADRWGHLAPRTYNKALSVLNDMFSWHVARGTLLRNPVATLERAKPRPTLRFTFSELQVARIFDANNDPRDQIALRLLLHYGIRKGALRGVRFGDFDQERRRVTVVTKGSKVHVLPLVDERIWLLLDELHEPPHHYLLPREKRRRRISVDRGVFQEASDALGDLAVAVAAVRDAAAARERALLEEQIEATFGMLGLMVEAAAFQIVSRYPDQPRGQHGLHLWWYRCLARAGVVEPGTTRGRRMHAARHTSIQRVLDRTGNLKAASVLAGHSSIGTTGDTYSGWETGQLAGTMETTLGLDHDLQRRAAASMELSRLQ